MRNSDFGDRYHHGTTRTKNSARSNPDIKGIMNSWPSRGKY